LYVAQPRAGRLDLPPKLLVQRLTSDDQDGTLRRELLKGLDQFQHALIGSYRAKKEKHHARILDT